MCVCFGSRQTVLMLMVSFARLLTDAVPLACGAPAQSEFSLGKLQFHPQRCGRWISSILLHKVQVKNQVKMYEGGMTCLISIVAVMVSALQGHTHVQKW